MADYVLRGVSEDGSVKLWLAQTTELCEEGRRRHDAWSVAAAALGRLLTAGVFFGQNLKNAKDSVTLRVNGDGPLGALTVVAGADGTVRGFVGCPHLDIPRREDGHLAVGAAIGNGTLTVIKDMGYGEPYSGTVNLVSGEIAEDVAEYFLESEQTPAAVGLGVSIAPDGTVGAAGGFMLQVLPHADEQVIKQLELNLAMLPSVSSMVANGLTLTEMGNEIMLGVPWRELTRGPIKYQCTCSRERMRGALVSLGYKELKELFDEKQAAGEDTEVLCRFCGEKYHFAPADLKEMVDELDRERFRRFAESLKNQVNLNAVATADVEDADRDDECECGCGGHHHGHHHEHKHGEDCDCGCHHHE